MLLGINFIVVECNGMYKLVLVETRKPRARLQLEVAIAYLLTGLTRFVRQVAVLGTINPETISLVT